MKKAEIRKIINNLLGEIEEEDIGICLFSAFFHKEEELAFFKEADRGRVHKILERLSSDSKRHKVLLEKIINHLGKKAQLKQNI